MKKLLKLFKVPSSKDCVNVPSRNPQVNNWISGYCESSGKPGYAVFTGKLIDGNSYK